MHVQAYISVQQGKAWLMQRNTVHSLFVDICRFMNGSLWISNKDIQVEGKSNTVIVVHISNEDYDESQCKISHALLEPRLNPIFVEQDDIKQLPLTRDMHSLYYKGFTDDGEDEVLGIALIYEDYKLCYSIETILDGKSKLKASEQKESFEAVKDVICKVLLAIKENKRYT
jgi:hypothetical protein